MAGLEERAFRRVVVALDVLARDDAAIESAAALAARLRAEIAGVFVEDVDLLHLASLRCARQVSLLTAAEELFDVAMLERELRVLAQQAQARISAAADRCRVHWSFRTVRGRIEAELPAATHASDLLVVVPPVPARHGGAGRLGRKLVECAAGPVLLLPRFASLGEHLLVYYDGSSSAEHALQTARCLVEAGGTLACVIAAATLVAARELENRVRDRLGGVAVEVRPVVPADATAVRTALGRAPLGLLVVAADCTLDDGTPVVERIDDLPRPLLLVQ
jgi:hypothetical protein